MSEEIKAVEVAENTFIHDLMEHCLMEFQAMPEVWQKLSKEKQDDAIYRLEQCVKDVSRQAIDTIASYGLTQVEVKVGNITIKDTVAEAKIDGPKGDHDFYDMQGTRAYLVVSDAQELPKQPHAHKGEEEQRHLDGLPQEEEKGADATTGSGATEPPPTQPDSVEAEASESSLEGKRWRISLEGSEYNGKIGVGVGYYLDENEKDVYMLRFEDGSEESFPVHCLFSDTTDGELVDADFEEVPEDAPVTLEGLPVAQDHCERVAAELTAKAPYEHQQAVELVAAAAVGELDSIEELEQNLIDDADELMAPFLESAGIERGAIDLGALE